METIQPQLSTSITDKNIFIIGISLADESGSVLLLCTIFNFVEPQSLHISGIV